MRKIVTLALAVSLMLSGCGFQTTEKGVVNAKNPVTITVWHYYNGSQKNAFDELVKEFNETAGAEQGIFVESHNQGNVNQLEESVMNSIEKKVGSAEIPNIFASYADTAYAIEKKGYLVDLSKYMSEEEIAEYTDSFIQEGRIGGNDELEILPVAKSSEIFVLNKTDWDLFAQATNASLDDISTKEGLVRTAQAYYEWTDSLTPDVPNDGKAFYGRDAMANLFIIGSMQLGHEIFHVENQKLQMDIDKEVMRKIWDFYYVPYVKGYFGSYGKFRSDDIKIGKIIALTGSSTAVLYFPNFVETKEGKNPIDALVMPVPGFEGGQEIAVQQGAGMVVTKSTEDKEYASVEFLKWFTQVDRNLEFSASSGYLPVKKAAVSQEMLEKALSGQEMVNPLMESAMDIGFDTIRNARLYTNRAFDGGSAARKVLEFHLADKAAEDRKAVEASLGQGKTLEEAVAPYTSEENFNNWFDSFRKVLEEAVKPS